MHFEKTCQGFLPSTKVSRRSEPSTVCLPDSPFIPLCEPLAPASLFSSLKSTCIPFPVPEVLLFPAPQMLFHLFYSFFPMLLLLLLKAQDLSPHMDFLASSSPGSRPYSPAFTMTVSVWSLFCEFLTRV